MAPSAPQLASARYLSQFQTVLDHQRKAFDAERVLWEVERSQLQEHISKLETALARINGPTLSQSTSPVISQTSASSIPGLSTSSRHNSTGQEFWHGAGGKSDAQPTRTFSSASQSAGGVSHLPSISENTPLTGFTEAKIPLPSVTEIQGGTFDGITFKQTSRAPSMTDGFTPLSPSPSHVSPSTIPMSSSKLVPPDAYVTEHAGHTPIAHGGDTPSNVSDSATPTDTKTERSPHELRASRPPSERSDSYFGDLTSHGLAMSGPLSLSNSRGSSDDKSFLDQVDSKLLKGASGQSSSDDAYFDPPEDVPPLKIKRSMNFGSQLGSSRGL